jgi:molybdopterin adenylyltransferase
MTDDSFKIEVFGTEGFENDTIETDTIVIDPIRIGVVTVSDRASRGEYEDRSGPAMRACLEEFLISTFEVLDRLVPDEQPLIEDTLRDLTDGEGCCLVVTSGGTGPAHRDVTVEATLAVGDKLMPGFGELMRQVSLEAVPTAILSRQEAVIRGQSLIVNLPGSPKAIRECLIAVFPAIPYCIDLLEGPYLETDEEVVQAFRPKK